MIQEKKSELLEALEKAETMDEVKSIEAEIEQISEHENLAKEKAAIMDNFKASAPVANERSEAKTLGEFAAKNLDLSRVKGVPGGSSATPYFKGSQTFTGYGVPEITTSHTVAEHPVKTPIIDALGKEEIDGNSYQWVVLAGGNGFAITAEGAKKPEISYTYGTVTKPLDNIAGWWKETQQLVDDNAYLETAIEGRGVQTFAAKREEIVAGQLKNQLYTTGITVTGNNAPAQAIKAEVEEITEQTPTAPQIADHIYAAMTAVKSNSGVDADTVIIGPDLAQILRTGRDTNGQYYGGGYFLGAYGNDGVEMMPNLWGMKVIVSDTFEGCALVGNFALGASYITKRGEGLRVNVTNSNEDDFVYNLLTVRIEQRGLLAIRDPYMFCMVVPEA